jgi:hypothetical protein
MEDKVAAVGTAQAKSWRVEYSALAASEVEVESNALG